MGEQYEELNKASNTFEVEHFCKLCDKAKGYLFDWLLSEEHDRALHAIYNVGIINSELTPIEQIFNICFMRYVAKYVPIIEIDNISLPMILEMELIPQEPIECGNYNYIADFVLDFSHTDDDCNFFYPTLKGLKYVIELDGMEYHSNKKQVNHDYEREQHLQMEGYKVVRFTGSQIYNKPYSCVHKLMCIIFNDMKEVLKDGDI